MQTTDEFKTILALVGNKRLPHMEAEIFANDELTTLYLKNLCKDYSLVYNHRDNNACLAYRYANYVLAARWPEAEATIKTRASCWISYKEYFGIVND